MKMIYGTAEPKIVVVEIAPNEVQLVYHGDEPDVLLHPAIAERTQEAMSAAGVGDNDIVSSHLDMSEEELATLCEAALHYPAAVPVVRARAPKRKIWRRSPAI